MKQFVFAKPISYLSGSGNYTIIHYADGSQELLSYTLRIMLDIAPYLIRVHKQAAVNPKYVKSWQLADKSNSIVVVRCGKTDYKLVVARRRVKALRILLTGA